MHENRETSSLAAGSKGSPAGEGLGHTSGVNGGEESDGVEVPMKRANKARDRKAEAAESVEGRTPTKENLRQNRTPPAQYGIRCVTRNRWRCVSPTGAMIRGRSRMR